jgi:hypothetical protein
MHAILKQALAQACVWRAVTHNPAALVKPPKVARAEMRTLDTETTAKMIEAARGTFIFIPVLLGVLCGLRAVKFALCVGARLIWTLDDYPLSLVLRDRAEVRVKKKPRPEGGEPSHCRQCW